MLFDKEYSTPLFFHILIASDDATANCYFKNSTTETILKCN